jgi:error-prone DNA polymerase
VCYCLGITEVDPTARHAMLFERFISEVERNEPPDIDVDFEHERREEVIQYIYGKYGRDRAALAASLITYRPRSALRDVGARSGDDTRPLDRRGHMQWWDGGAIDAKTPARGGFDPKPARATAARTAHELIGFPRHLSQHVGGFVIARGRLSGWCRSRTRRWPIARVIQWDKDDLDALGLLKVDVLALGMLTAIRKSLDFARAEDGGATHPRLAMQPSPTSRTKTRHLRHAVPRRHRPACSRSNHARR